MTNNKNLRKNCVPILDEILFLHYIGELTDAEKNDVKEQVRQSLRTGQTENIVRFLSEKREVSGHPECYDSLLELL